MEFIREVLPIFQIIQAVAIPALFYQVLKIHKKRLILTERREERILKKEE